LTCTDFEEDHGRERSQLGEQRDEGGRGADVRARGVELRNRVASAGGGRLDRKLVGQVHLIPGEALRGGLGERLDAVPDGDAG
jgi:hypothetical protein